MIPFSSLMTLLGDEETEVQVNRVNDLRSLS